MIQTDHAQLRHFPNHITFNSRVWKGLATLQGYNLEIILISLKKNTEGPSYITSIEGALVKKGSA